MKSDPQACSLPAVRSAICAVILATASITACASAYATQGSAAIELFRQGTAQTYGYGDTSTADDRALAEAAGSDDPGIQYRIRAESQAAGQVSVDMSIRSSEVEDRLFIARSEWIGWIRNDTDATADYLVTLRAEAFRSEQFELPAIPAGGSAATEATAAFSGSIASFLLTPDGRAVQLDRWQPGEYTFSLGVRLDPGQQTWVSLLTTARLETHLGGTVACPDSDTGPAGCPSQLPPTLDVSYRSRMSVVSITAVPEPGSFVLAGIGLMAATGLARRRRDPARSQRMHGVQPTQHA